MNKRFLLTVVLASAFGVSSVSLQAQDEDIKSIGFTWWNDVPSLVEEGNQSFEGMDYETSEQFYRDAMVLNPDEAVTSFNLGLAKGAQDQASEALPHFYSALDKAGKNQALRQKSFYNIGVGQWKQVVEEMEKEEKDRDEDAMLKRGLAALDAFNASLKLNPEDAKAQENKNQIQHFLQKMSEMPPPQEQQQNQDQQCDNPGDGGQGDQQNDQQNQQQENQDQQKQQEQQDQQDQQQQQEQEQSEQEQSEQEQQEQQEQEQQEEQEQAAQEEQEREEMTPEQARQMLNILGEDQNIVLRKGRSRSQPEPTKRW